MGIVATVSIQYSTEVSAALSSGSPVVALE